MQKRFRDEKIAARLSSRRDSPYITGLARLCNPDFWSAQLRRLNFESKTHMTSPQTPLLPGTDWGTGPDDYLAICARGLECVAADELRQLGAEKVTEVIGGVRFEGPPAVLYRACLRLRSVSRIVRTLRDFASQTADMLYSQVRRVAWEKILTLETTFSVHANLQGAGARSRQADQPDSSASHRGRGIPPGATRGINHSHFAALKIKDAIVDRMRQELGARPNVNTQNPDVRVHAYFAGGRCVLSIDATGTSLHERGYRQQSSEAPLKETLAAALVDFSGWDGIQPFYDPMCGSGTIVIEAALKALRIAPGLRHDNVGFRHWPDYDAALWQQTLAETRALQIDPQTGSPLPRIWAGDIDPAAIEATKVNAQAAGVAHVIQFIRGRIEDSLPPVSEPGILLTNPPYGVRLGAGKDKVLAGLYEKIGHAWGTRFPGWKGFVFAGNLGLAPHLKLPAVGKRKLYNGPLECRLLEFSL